MNNVFRRQVQWFPPAFCILPHACITRQLTDFRKEYKWNFSPEASICDAKTSAPSAGVSALLACLWLMSYLLLFLEAYATRLRRNICASFFKKQAERRVAFWNAKGQAKQDRKGPGGPVLVVCRWHAQCWPCLCGFFFFFSSVKRMISKNTFQWAAFQATSRWGEHKVWTFNT